MGPTIGDLALLLSLACLAAVRGAWLVFYYVLLLAGGSFGVFVIVARLVQGVAD